MRGRTIAGFQFGHIQTFSLKGNDANFSIADIAAEAARLEGAYSHVEHPLPPSHVAGSFRPEDVPAEIERRMAEAKVALRGKHGPTGNILRIRRDTHLMEGQVHSYPAYTKAPPPDHYGEERPCLEDPKWHDRYLRWREELIDWVRKDAFDRGLEVLSVVEHLDESHPHIHALLVPLQTEANPRMDAKVTHPGHAAQSRRKDQARRRIQTSELMLASIEQPNAMHSPAEPARSGADIGRRKPRKRRSKPKSAPTNSVEKIVSQLGARAYKAAMREWQTRLFEQCGAKHGLTRHGPRYRRLTRAEWRRTQADAEVVMNTNELNATLREVGDAFTDSALKAAENAQTYEDRADRARREADALEAKLASAKQVIRDASLLGSDIQQLEKKKTQIIEQYCLLAEHVSASEAKIRDGQLAEQRKNALENSLANLDKRIIEANAKLRETYSEAARHETNAAQYKAEVEEARQTIQDANLLKPTILALQGEKDGLERAVKSLTAQLVEDQKKRDAVLEAEQRLERAKKEEFALAVRAEGHRQEAQRLREANAITLEERDSFEAERKRLTEREERLDLKELTLAAKSQGLADWAEGHLSVQSGKLTLIPNVQQSPRGSQPTRTYELAEDWLVTQIEKLERLFAKRLAQKAAELVEITKVTIAAWAKGVVFRSDRQEQGIALNVEKIDEIKEFRERVANYRGFVSKLVLLLPNLNFIHDTFRQAKKSRSIMTDAENRQIQLAEQRFKEMQGNGR